jgi:hypothetical protein
MLLGMDAQTSGKPIDVTVQPKQASFAKKNASKV